ncbi:unnamed protein product [Clonostachys rosea]|uniref:Tryptophan synthase beta chain-like PALP domain-containing protein n=1 Tax=Bionectria ochroleuca TaxID=29856 RepID=A0ABY6UID2_BIOOC|nr:unnamed protein product [Clonostachys rosea]
MASLSTCPPLTRQSVVEARETIRHHIHETPVVSSEYLNRLASTDRHDAAKNEVESSEAEFMQRAKPVMRLWFKCENMQKVGAFKARGAFHAVERLKQEPDWLENGGLRNHAQAVALAAQQNSMPAHVVMPETSSAVKIKSVETYGAQLTLCPRFDRELVAAQVIERTGARLIPPYDHPDVILGQGTCGLELQHQTERLDAIISPSSGGGLLSGTALSCEGTGIRVYGAEPEFEGADDGRRGFLSGKRITHVESSTIADGLIGKLGQYPWDIIYERRLVDMMYAVSEEEILQAMKLIYERLKLVVEPAAAVSLAVALYNEEFRQMVEKTAGEAGWDIGIILSGGNIGTERMAELFSKLK